MTPSPTHKPKNRALNTMQAKGFALCALGLGLLPLPLFMGQSPMLVAYASALRPAGGFALVAGVVLLGIHYVTNAKLARARATPLPQPAPDVSAPTGQPTLRDIRAELQKKAATPDA